MRKGETKRTRPTRLGRWAIVLGLVLTLTLFVKIAQEVYETQARSRLVKSIVEAQRAEIQELKSVKSLVDAKLEWPDEFAALQNWLIVESLKPNGPERVALELKSLRASHGVSPIMEHSLVRWNDSLSRWAAFDDLSHIQESENQSTYLLEEGRRRHQEATGYRNIGRSYDATGQYLWASALLTRFIEESPLDPQLPEALYLLGDSYIRFRHALPNIVQTDRVLKLLWELYPQNIWAIRAQQAWRDEMREAKI